jgi:AcrR family transcriptional regulator
MLESDGVGGFTARRIAHEADTSMPAVYELFGDKAGLVREVFFEGFRLLRRQFEQPGEPADPLAALVRVIETFRAFARANPVLSDVMFSQPFADFDPGPAELKAGSAVRDFIVERVRRCLKAGVLAGDELDIAHVLVALAQGPRRRRSVAGRSQCAPRWPALPPWLSTQASHDRRAHTRSSGATHRRRADRPLRQLEVSPAHECEVLLVRPGGLGPDTAAPPLFPDVAAQGPTAALIDERDLHATPRWPFQIRRQHEAALQGCQFELG